MLSFVAYCVVEFFMITVGVTWHRYRLIVKQMQNVDVKLSFRHAICILSLYVIYLLAALFMCSRHRYHITINEKIGNALLHLQISLIC